MFYSLEAQHPKYQKTKPFNMISKIGSSNSEYKLHCLVVDEQILHKINHNIIKPHM